MVSSQWSSKATGLEMCDDVASPFSLHCADSGFKRVSFLWHLKWDCPTFVQWAGVEPCHLSCHTVMGSSGHFLNALERLSSYFLLCIKHLGHSKAQGYGSEGGSEEFLPPLYHLFYTRIGLMISTIC